MAEWRHGGVIVLPKTLTEALESMTRCMDEDERFRRLCVEEAAVDLLALLVEERNPGWRSRGVRAQSMLELAARYISWLRVENGSEELRWELLRRAYNSAAAAAFSAPKGLKGAKQLVKALVRVRDALIAKKGFEEALSMLEEAVRKACTPGYCFEDSGRASPRERRAYGLEASALPP
jgi:hypothetical protein